MKLGALYRNWSKSRCKRGFPKKSRLIKTLYRRGCFILIEAYGRLIGWVLLWVAQPAADDIVKIFNALDTNKDGKVSKDEVRSFFPSITLLNRSNEHLVVVSSCIKLRRPKTGRLSEAFPGLHTSAVQHSINTLSRKKNIFCVSGREGHALKYGWTAASRYPLRQDYILVLHLFYCTSLVHQSTDDLGLKELICR
jgi:EF hand